MVKKIITILLISAYLFSATDLKELLKINVVIQHLHEHQKTDSDVSLLQFLVMHYVTDDNNDKDDERDKQLPFKSPGTFSTYTSVVFNSEKFFTFAAPAYIRAQNNFQKTKNFFVMNCFRNQIWHPPQFC